MFCEKKQAPQLVREERSLELQKQLTQCLNSEGNEPFGDERDFSDLVQWEACNYENELFLLCWKIKQRIRRTRD